MNLVPEPLQYTAVLLAGLITDRPQFPLLVLELLALPLGQALLLLRAGLLLTEGRQYQHHSAQPRVLSLILTTCLNLEDLSPNSVGSLQ